MWRAEMRQWAGPVLGLLLQHVAQVQLCSALLELLDSRQEWHDVKHTTRKHEATLSITCTGTPINPRPCSLPPPPQYHPGHCSTSAGYRYGARWADTD